MVTLWCVENGLKSTHCFNELRKRLQAEPLGNLRRHLVERDRALRDI